MAHPILSISDVREHTGLAFPGASSGMGVLAELGIAQEITGRGRNRLFAYGDYLEVLSEGTEM